MSLNWSNGQGEWGKVVSRLWWGDSASLLTVEHQPPACSLGLSFFIHKLRERVPFTLKVSGFHPVAEQWICRLEPSLQRTTWFVWVPTRVVAVPQRCLLRSEQVGEGARLSGASHCPCSYLSSHTELFQKVHLLMDPRQMSLLSRPVEQLRAGELSKWPVGPIFWDVITHG